MYRKEDYIAVFDSGVGGISVLRQLRKLMPGENYIYYGDSANAPYGSRTTEEVRTLTLAAAQKLIDSVHFFQHGVSWGGFESLIIDAGVGLSEEESREFGVPQNLIRIHVGLENASSLIADLEQALTVLPDEEK